MTIKEIVDTWDIEEQLIDDFVIQMRNLDLTAISVNTFTTTAFLVMPSPMLFPARSITMFLIIENRFLVTTV